MSTIRFDLLLQTKEPLLEQINRRVNDDRRRIKFVLLIMFVVSIVLIPRTLGAQSCTSECPDGDSDCPGGLVCLGGVVCGCSDACDDPSCDPNYDCDCLAARG